MADILIFFSWHSSYLTNLVLEFKNSKEYFTLNEATWANLNADKRILKVSVILHKVYRKQAKYLVKA